MTKEQKEVENLCDYTCIIIETDEKNPETIAVLSPDEMYCKRGLRIRLNPKYD